MKNVTSTAYKTAFWDAMRGREATIAQMSNGAEASGAYPSPDDFQAKFATALAKGNLFRRLATVVRVSVPASTIQAVASTGTAAWVPESTVIPESADAFTQFPIKAHKLAGLTRLKESFVSDPNFDLEGYLLNEFARRFGRAEEAACIGGDGEEQPTGILSAAGAEVGVTTANAGQIAYDEAVRLYFALKAEYRANAVFLMNDETAIYLRTVRDAAGNPLWNTANDTILSKPVVTSPFVPTISAGAPVIVFGDLSYYWIIERQPLTIKRLNELYAAQGEIGFSGFERLDGRLVRREAVKVMKMAG